MKVTKYFCDRCQKEIPSEVDVHKIWNPDGNDPKYVCKICAQDMENNFTMVFGIKNAKPL